MLTRVLEPEAMDDAQEASEYDAMDHSHVNRLFVDDFLRTYFGDGRVLDVGTGTARIPIELCGRHPRIVVEAIDASAAMLDLAKAVVDRAGLPGRIATRLADAKRLPYADGSFAAVMSNSIAHHIPEPRDALAEMVRVAAPGAVVFVRDLLRPATDADVNALVAQYAAGCNSRQKKLFDDSLRAALSLDEIRELVVGLGFEPETVRSTSDRHWTWIARR